MSLNNRIFYACQAVAIANHGTAVGNYNSNNVVHGLQSVGMTTNFNLEQAFELGQIDIYENIEGVPDVEMTLEKVLDGYALIYHMATTGVTGQSASGLAARSKERCDVRLGIFDEARNSVAGIVPEVEVYCSGMYVSSVSYTLNTDGNSTESVTLVGNNKQWLTANQAMSTGVVSTLNGSDSPLALNYGANGGSGGIQRREDVILKNCILPQSIRGVNGSGVGNAVSPTGSNSGLPLVHLQSVTISTDFGREPILELGRKTPYYRPATFPIEVTCEIEAISTSGDFVSALEAGDPSLYQSAASGNNTGEEIIYIETRAGYAWDLGAKNRLSSVSYGGGDAGGGNVSCTYSYSTFNNLDVQHSGTLNVTKRGYKAY